MSVLHCLYERTKYYTLVHQIQGCEEHTHVEILEFSGLCVYHNYWDIIFWKCPVTERLFSGYVCLCKVCVVHVLGKLRCNNIYLFVCTMLILENFSYVQGLIFSLNLLGTAHKSSAFCFEVRCKEGNLVYHCYTLQRT